MKVKERLRALRAERRETQKHGKHLPSLENAWKLADHFNVTVDYLIGRTDDR